MGLTDLLLAVGGVDKHVHLYAAELNGAPVFERVLSLKGHEDWIRSVAFAEALGAWRTRTRRRTRGAHTRWHSRSRGRWRAPPLSWARWHRLVLGERVAGPSVPPVAPAAQHGRSYGGRDGAHVRGGASQRCGTLSDPGCHRVWRRGGHDERHATSTRRAADTLCAVGGTCAPPPPSGARSRVDYLQLPGSADVLAVVLDGVLSGHRDSVYSVAWQPQATASAGARTRAQQGRMRSPHDRTGGGPETRRRRTGIGCGRRSRGPTAADGIDGQDHVPVAAGASVGSVDVRRAGRRAWRTKRAGFLRRPLQPRRSIHPRAWLQRRLPLVDRGAGRCVPFTSAEVPAPWCRGIG